MGCADVCVCVLVKIFTEKVRGKTLWERERFADDFYLNDGLVSRRDCVRDVEKRGGVLNVLGILM